jgi:glutamate-1-semialdehyde 2,1-aminomutase
MECVTPLGRATHSGTYNGHLLAILAGLAALEEYSRPDFYPHLHALADRLYPGLQEVFDKAGVKAHIQGLGARFYIYFGLDQEVTTYAQACRRDRELERRFWSAAIRHGVYFHAGVHYGFSAAHTMDDVERILEACAAAAREVSGPG